VLRGVVVAAVLAACTYPALAGISGSGSDAGAGASCARLYRQSVRSLGDGRAGKVARKETSTAIAKLASLRRPRGLRSGSPRAKGAERRVYRISARLVAVRLGSGQARTGEIELVVADRRTGRRLVVGFADPACSMRRRQAEAASARESLLAACGVPPDTHYANVRGSAEIAGVGFFGSLRGPFATRNGLQLRPALEFGADACSVEPERPAIVAAAGDIACDPANPAFNNGLGSPRACRMRATSDLLAAGGYDAVFPLGDTQYDYGGFPAFTASYEPTWGRVKAITRAVVGNHEYGIPGAKGYFRYFGRAAGPSARGYYSFDLAAWHVVVLNGNCSVAPCRAGSRQERWLEDDLSVHTNRCTLALWHQPLFSSGLSGGSPSVRPFWNALFRAGADLVLNGHDHDYERFAPKRPSGVLDPERGIREFVVGTGGASFGPWDLIRPGSEVRENRTFGVLRLTLLPSSYEWQFVPEAGATFTDSGSGSCH